MPQAALADADEEGHTAPQRQRGDRAKLRTAIKALQTVQARVTALEQGQERAAQEQRAARDCLQEAEGALANAKRNERQRLAEAFVSGQEVASPIADAEARVEQAKRELERLQELEAALAEEVKKAQGQLTFPRIRFREALAEVMTQSPELQALFDQMHQAWENIRTCRAALAAVSHGLAGYMPGPLHDRAQAVEPIDERVGYGIDREVVERWRAALEALSNDADADLPQI